MWVDSADKTRVHSFIVKPPEFFAHHEISRAVPDSRRPARRVGRILDLSLERAGVRRRRLSGRDAESARLHRLRAEVHRRDQWRLGRQSLRRHHGGGRCRRCAALRRSPIAWRRRAAPTAATWSTGCSATPRASKRWSRTTASSICAAWRRETEELWFPLWEFKGMPWDNPELYSQVVAQLFREGFQDAYAGDPRRAGLSRAGRPGLATVHRAAIAEGAVEAALFPDEGHWVLKPQNSVLWYHTVSIGSSSGRSRCLTFELVILSAAKDLLFADSFQIAI